MRSKINRLIFRAPVGDDFLEVDVHSPEGMGGTSFFVMVSGYYWGSIMKPHGVWRGNWHLEQRFTIDDIQALGERIEEAGLLNKD